jgi:hypothetical protein
MKTLFLDMEWGQVYGSYRRDFIPIEVGAVISSLQEDHPVLESKKFYHNVELVIRRNKVNDIGKTVGFSETVANIAKGEYQKRFDPSYRLQKSDKPLTRDLSRKALRELHRYIHALLTRHRITQVVLFGGVEDLNLLKRAGINTCKIQTVDIQQLIVKEIGYLFSLDKISLIMGFYSDNNFFGSRNLRFPLPERYKYLVKPHKAIGDACRIFVVHQEFCSANSTFKELCIGYLHANQVQKAIPGSIIETKSQHKHLSEVG